MEVFLMICCHETTIFTNVKEQSNDDGKTLGECSFTSQRARPQAAAPVELAFRADEAFEDLCIEPFSSPPELPALCDEAAGLRKQRQ
ncbi:hypothetical protein J1605_013612 [Eschrichtius robustus]|uniref:Uncharacterized protein n=1 Tax=Eschrichtius robustus TaxID=9764 RepID=A0AB34GIV0_ESCRO|nr:hypothetical protein J1605_013612 [Eschrichtius robustus]